VVFNQFASLPVVIIAHAYSKITEKAIIFVPRKEKTSVTKRRK